MVIDDAHQADTMSLWLLSELAPTLRAMPVAVLVTAREGDRAWQGRLSERAALLRSGLVITLPPFGEDDVAGLLAGVSGAPAMPDLVRVIAERSGGSPLLVTELARHLASREASTDEARVLVPDSVLVITRARLAELPESTRSILGSAAVLGARFRRDVLAQLTAVPAGELADALAAGRDARLIEAAGPGEDQFRHELVRDAIYDAIPEAAREERHAQAWQGAGRPGWPTAGTWTTPRPPITWYGRAQPHPGRRPTTPAARATRPWPRWPSRTRRAGTSTLRRP